MCSQSHWPVEAHYPASEASDGGCCCTADVSGGLWTCGCSQRTGQPPKLWAAAEETVALINCKVHRSTQHPINKRINHTAVHGRVSVSAPCMHDCYDSVGLLALVPLFLWTCAEWVLSFTFFLKCYVLQMHQSIKISNTYNTYMFFLTSR